MVVVYTSIDFEVKEYNRPKGANHSGCALPYRVFPGKLSVSRTIGDVKAKLAKFKGIPNVVIAEPDIVSFKADPELDFLVLGSDGIFDKMTSQEVITSAWSVYKRKPSKLTVHPETGEAAETILREAMEHETYDNVTAVIVAFEGIVEATNKFVQHQTVKRATAAKYSPQRTCNQWTINSQRDLKIKKLSGGVTGEIEKKFKITLIKGTRPIDVNNNNNTNKGGPELPMHQNRTMRSSKFERYYKLLDI